MNLMIALQQYSKFSSLHHTTQACSKPRVGIYEMKEQQTCMCDCGWENCKFEQDEQDDLHKRPYILWLNDFGDYATMTQYVTSAMSSASCTIVEWSYYVQQMTDDG